MGLPVLLLSPTPLPPERPPAMERLWPGMSPPGCDSGHIDPTSERRMSLWLSSRSTLWPREKLLDSDADAGAVAMPPRPATRFLPSEDDEASQSVQSLDGGGGLNMPASFSVARTPTAARPNFLSEHPASPGSERGERGGSEFPLEPLPERGIEAPRAAFAEAFTVPVAGAVCVDGGVE